MREKLMMNDSNDGIAEIYKESFGDVYKFVYHKVRNRHVAEDIVHDAFLVALTKREEFLNHPKPKAWLMTTARYKLMELNKKLKRWDMEYLEDLPELVEPGNCYERIELELSALATISEDEWNMLKEYYLYGIDAATLAEREGITENNMNVRLTRLKKKLRESIGPKEG